MKEIERLKKAQYDYIYKYYNYVAKWKPYSYRKIKVATYVNVCAWLVYFFTKFNIKPNTVTLVYALMGLFGGIFLALPYDAAVLAAVVFFYFRPFLDWADGPLARELKQTSLTGDILDSYAAPLGWMSLWAGMGLYLARTVHYAFYLFSPMLIFFFAVDLYAIARERFIYHHLVGSSHGFSDELNSKFKKDNLVVNIDMNSRVIRIKHMIDAVFEHNSRTIDLICYGLLAEIYFSVSILWIYYLMFLCWQASIFAVRLIVLYRGGWAERELCLLKSSLYEKK